MTGIDAALVCFVHTYVAPPLGEIRAEIAAARYANPDLDAAFALIEQDRRYPGQWSGV